MGCIIITLLAAHPYRVTRFSWRSYDNRVARHDHVFAKIIPGAGVRCFNIGLLRPVCPIADENVGGTGFSRRVASLISIYPSGIAVLSAPTASTKRLKPAAPTTIVSPESETGYPNQSPAPVLEALTYACWLQFVPSLVKT